MLEKVRLGGGVLERGEAGEPWSGACCAATTPRSHLPRQRRRAAAGACAPSHRQPCLPGSVVPARQGGLDGGRRALSPITDHRNVKTRTWWIVREPMVGGHSRGLPPILIRKFFFVHECRREAGLTEIFA
jgi:hypothetical protein